MNSKFSISVKDIRAIKNAEIELNGITVLSGVNGCGKTTISKLLYSFIKTSVNFNTVVSDLYKKELSFSSDFLDDFVPRKNKKDFESDDEIKFSRVNEMDAPVSKTYYSEDYLSEVIIPRIRLIRQKYEEKEYSISSTAFSRLLYVYERWVRKINVKNVVELLSDYEAYITNLMNEISELKINRNLKVFHVQNSKYFNENTEKWNFSIKEYGSSLINRKNKSVVLQKSFSDAFYIDVPTVFDNASRGVSALAKDSVLADLRKALSNNKEFAVNENEEISGIITDALNGKISIRNDMFSRIFIYTSKDGLEIPLSQAASGLKCFAVLERLYANGCLRDDTLLIVDEPEVHLHPKWIVEYARVLVLIQKHLHTTILIASHNPDMISAIKYISAKENTVKDLIFYIAKETDADRSGKYSFYNLETDIEEIFSSFNIALDRINQYGAFDDE